jgi:glucokinase
VLAVDFGGTKTTTALVDQDGAVHRRRKQPSGRSLRESVAQVAESYADTKADAEAIGVIVPGIFHPGTGMSWCPNLWGHEEVPLLAALREEIGVPIAADCDRSGYVLGESWLGVARGLRDVVYVAIGTGVGVGILSDNRVVRGAHGIAGAAGWMAVGPDWQEAFARSGEWEALSAGPSVAMAYGAPDAETVVAAAGKGDRRAVEALNRAAIYAGRGIANLISVLNPEIVVLGGGLLQGARDWMLPVIRQETLRWAQPIAAQRCRLEMTELGEDAGLLGAARLAHGEVEARNVS